MSQRRGFVAGNRFEFTVFLLPSCGGKTVPLPRTGVSQNGKRFALQVATYSSDHLIKRERFVIYSVDKGDSIAEVAPPQLPEAQSWTAFSPDGSLFVVGSPLKLTLYRLP
jgi:hypothetical protein